MACARFEQILTSHAGETFQGNAVIITLPLGCLKAGAIIFQPALPEWKADAIAKLGNGNLNKVRTACISRPIAA